MSSPAGVIHDIGYQRYRGPRLGAGYVFGSLFASSLRTVFGFGRGAKSKIFPWFVVSVVGVVSIVLLSVRALTGTVAIPYENLPQQLTPLLILFCAIAAPELVSRDLHSGVLPLYFSRPLPSFHYALAKLLALVTAFVIVVGGGQFVMFIGAAFTVDGFGNVMNELADVALAIVYTGIYAVVFSSIAVLVSSLMKRRAVAAGAVVAVFLITTPIVPVLFAMPSQTANELALIVSPASLVGGVGDWIFGSGEGEIMDIGPFGPLYAAVAVALVAVCALLLNVRYRKVSQS